MVSLRVNVRPLTSFALVVPGVAEKVVVTPRIVVGIGRKPDVVLTVLVQLLIGHHSEAPLPLSFGLARIELV